MVYTEEWKNILKITKWRDNLCSWVERLNTVKMSVLPTLISRFSTIPIKISESYFVDIDKWILKFM